MKKLLIIFTTIWITACAGPDLEWVIPKSKTDKDFYSDKNICTAEAKKVTGNNDGPYHNDYWVSCIKAKGYKLRNKS